MCNVVQCVRLTLCFQPLGADEESEVQGGSWCSTVCQVQVSQKVERTGTFKVMFVS